MSLDSARAQLMWTMTEDDLTYEEALFINRGGAIGVVKASKATHKTVGLTLTVGPQAKPTLTHPGTSKDKPAAKPAAKQKQKQKQDPAPKPSTQYRTGFETVAKVTCKGKLVVPSTDKPARKNKTGAGESAKKTTKQPLVMIRQKGHSGREIARRTCTRD